MKDIIKALIEKRKIKKLYMLIMSLKSTYIRTILNCFCVRIYQIQVLNGHF